ncbi:MAG: hypothetical protein A2234_07520 [Elusimicrobia bacterium RIFOXYA2_FULL_58_8]|nr:MAG: hypothetical protein A2234_07520 [Elusimicrobia bacterium RIFOXYA2_FULL_58_8]OGS13718.1 MAG: hypothetical protein A2285_01285 [Elusimicrobia bacterium RIFOXYA12_FULL_57_11]
MKLSKDQMTSGYLTHELRAPLTAIRCALEVFLNKNQEELQEEDRKILEIALRNTSKLNLLINDIMELSKIQTGRMQMFPVPTDPVQLARETAEEMYSWVQRAKLTLTVDAPEKCARVLADRRRTAQSLTNLISNALKFTPPGGSINVTVEEGKLKHSGFVIISVKDTGCGIAPEDILKVFGYFVQAGPSDKRTEGSGLGLSLARSMIELQGGTMWAASRPGEGSTFSFTLPVHVPGA